MASVKMIGVTGGSCCGKSTVCKLIVELLPPGSSVKVLSQENFYRPVEATSKLEESNFDHPGIQVEAIASLVENFLIVFL